MDYAQWRTERYKQFNEKINYFQKHIKYKWLRKYADDAMSANEGGGLGAIIGEDFIKRIEQASLDYIAKWLNGENKLEWSGITASEPEND